MGWIKEIKKVGFRDWFWFVFILKRNEFHSSLNISSYIIGDYRFREKRMVRLMARRQKAHDIDNALANLK